MGFLNVNEERSYKELVRAIRSSKIDNEVKVYFLNYLEEIKDGKRNNDFYDFDFLRSVIVELCFNEYDSYEELVETFNRLISRTRTLLPQGDKTEGYESIKREIINNYCDIERNNIFSAKLYSLFSNRIDYLQIMDIILSDDNLNENFEKIEQFAVELGKEISDEGLLKREIISYLHLYGSILSDDESYLEERINEARMRYGVYPGINEKTMAVISNEVTKAKGILRKLEILEKKVDGYVERVDAKTKEGIKLLNETVLEGKQEIITCSTDAVKQMHEDLAAAKKGLLDELNQYLVHLEELMKTNSDKVFNQILIDAKEKLEQIRMVAGSLSGTTTKELLRIQNETEKSLDLLRRYVETNPELRQSLKVVEDSEEVMSALMKFKELQDEQGKIIVPESGLLVPQKEIIIPDDKESFLVPEFTMTEGILPAFDRSRKFEVRMKEIEKRIKELESMGYIIPPVLKEALPWYLMGKKIVYFYGPTQSGKTTVADLLAKVVGTELLDGGKITEEHSITSYNDVRGVFDENALFYALYYGKSILYDELDNGNPDNLIVLGTFASKLVNKVDNPEKTVTVQFAKRRFVPINVNARIIAAGNTTGKGRNKQYSARSKFDESSLERLVPFYVGYSEEVERQIFGQYTEMLDFFNFFRKTCNEYGSNNGMDSSEGNVTTGDASTIVECIKEESITISNLVNAIFVQVKEEDYLGDLIDNVKKHYKIEDISEESIANCNMVPLATLKAKDIARVFIYEAKKAMSQRSMIKRK